MIWLDLFLENSLFMLPIFNPPPPCMEQYLWSRAVTIISQFILRDHVITLRSLCAIHSQNALVVYTAHFKIPIYEAIFMVT